MCAHRTETQWRLTVHKNTTTAVVCYIKRTWCGRAQLTVCFTPVRASLLRQFQRLGEGQRPSTFLELDGERSSSQGRMKLANLFW